MSWSSPLRCITATLTIARRDGVAVSPKAFTRVATASYSRSGQVLAENAAAESLRLAVLAGFSR